ncbi:uncharacterized protein LOC128238511 [Mya arenaria]|uniref:uncharacterized protein LOC128238511 n=1 Tax=Mya arenaria TaxID=6604 RepID=UPI0022E09382|nr:uncharacterized protein LOC128238511 [Mya arenaria]
MNLGYIKIFFLLVASRIQLSFGDHDKANEDKALWGIQQENQRILRQNIRFRKVFAEMLSVCQSLSVKTCKCEKDSSNEEHASLSLVSIESSGSDDNITTTNVTVTYLAPKDHTLFFVVLFSTSAIWQTGGQERETSDDIVNQYARTLVLSRDEIKDIVHIETSITGHGEQYKLILDVESIKYKHIDHFADVQPFVVDLQYSNFHLAEEGLNVTGLIRADWNKYERSIDLTELWWSGYDLSSTPPSVVEFVHPSFDKQGNSMLKIAFSFVDDSVMQFNAVIDKEVSKYGGYFAVRLTYKQSSYLIKHFYVGKDHILEPRMTEIPDNLLALSPLPKDVFIWSQKYSFQCLANGNPTPEVSIVRVTKDGKEKKVKTESFVFDKMTRQETVTFEEGNQKPGTYICRATNGKTVINATTEVTFFKHATFEYERTGVIKNSSKEIRVSCKASGNPRPTLNFLLYEKTGPALLPPDFMVATTRKSEGVTRKVLTLTVEESKKLHTLVCAAEQNLTNARNDAIALTTIYLYPGMSLDMDWQFYNRLAATGTNYTTDLP